MMMIMTMMMVCFYRGNFGPQWTVHMRILANEHRRDKIRHLIVVQRDGLNSDAGDDETARGIFEGSVKLDNEREDLKPNPDGGGGVGEPVKRRSWSSGVCQPLWDLACGKK